MTTSHHLTGVSSTHRRRRRRCRPSTSSIQLNESVQYASWSTLSLDGDYGDDDDDGKVSYSNLLLELFAAAAIIFGISQFAPADDTDRMEVRGT